LQIIFIFFILLIEFAIFESYDFCEQDGSFEQKSWCNVRKLLHNVWWWRCYTGFFKIFFVAKHRKMVGGCTRVRITLSWQGRRTKGRKTKSEVCTRTAIRYYALFLVCRADKKYKRKRRSICLYEHRDESLRTPRFLFHLPLWNCS